VLTVTLAVGIERTAAWWMVESDAAGSLLSSGGGDPVAAFVALAFVAIRLGVRWLGPGVALWLGLWALWPGAKRSRARCASAASAAG
jgi:hypothetical protein